jgi:hypothetical protein
MKIVEFQNEIDELADRLRGAYSVWYPMWVDNEKHPNNNTLSFVYVRVSGEDYILPHKHVDTLSLTLDTIRMLWDCFPNKWVFGKKKWGQTIGRWDGVDMDSLYFTKGGGIIPDITIKDVPAFTFLYHNGYRNDVVQSTPIMKLGEVIGGHLDKYQPFQYHHPNIQWLSNDVIPTLGEVERFGIRVDRAKFLDSYSASHHKHLTGDNLIFTEYNPYILTGRPSNRHGGINFSALNHNTGIRRTFISDHIFHQYDYDAYHIRLIASLIKYPLPQTSVHQWLADGYGTSYEEGKGITFQLLYGGIHSEFLSIPFFNSVHNFIQTLWRETVDKGYIQTPKRRIQLDRIEGANPQKVFNYLLQSVETERNIEVIKRILQHIRETPVRMPLYVYDAFLFDIPDGWDTTGLKEILESGGFPTRVSIGTNYEEV